MRATSDEGPARDNASTSALPSSDLVVVRPEPSAPPHPPFLLRVSRAPDNESLFLLRRARSIAVASARAGTIGEMTRWILRFTKRLAIQQVPRVGDAGGNFHPAGFYGRSVSCCETTVCLVTLPNDPRVDRLAIVSKAGTPRGVTDNRWVYR